MTVELELNQRPSADASLAPLHVPSSPAALPGDEGADEQSVGVAVLESFGGDRLHSEDSLPLTAPTCGSAIR